jgi:uncharacterized protein (DUF3084 family)
MTDSVVLEILRGIQVDLATVRTDLATVRTDLAGVKTDHSAMRAELVDVRADLRALRADVTPMLQRNLTVTQQEVRTLKAAFNDFALSNPAG